MGVSITNKFLIVIVIAILDVPAKILSKEAKYVLIKLDIHVKRNASTGKFRLR